MSYDTPSNAVNFKFAILDQVASKVEKKYGATTLLMREPSSSVGDTGTGVLLVKVPVGLSQFSPGKTFAVAITEVTL